MIARPTQNSVVDFHLIITRNLVHREVVNKLKLRRGFVQTVQAYCNIISSRHGKQSLQIRTIFYNDCPGHQGFCKTLNLAMLIHSSDPTSKIKQSPCFARPINGALAIQQSAMANVLAIQSLSPHWFA
jgi:hypothetical protein